MGKRKSLIFDERISPIAVGLNYLPRNYLGTKKKRIGTGLHAWVGHTHSYSGHSSLGAGIGTMAKRKSCLRERIWRESAVVRLLIPGLPEWIWAADFAFLHLCQRQKELPLWILSKQTATSTTIQNVRQHRARSQRG